MLNVCVTRVDSWKPAAVVPFEFEEIEHSADDGFIADEFLVYDSVDGERCGR